MAKKSPNIRPARYGSQQFRWQWQGKGLRENNGLFDVIYVISDLRFDLERRQLTRHGKPIKLTRLDFKVLRTLVEAAPALVRHEDLITQVWGPDRVITPENLSQRIKSLRNSLGDDPGDPTYVEGVRGQGFRLIPEVEAQSTRNSGPGPKRVWALGLIGLLAGLLAWFAADFVRLGDSGHTRTAAVESSDADRFRQPSIAILPFANLSADPSNQYFADGIHDDLVTRISNLQNIKTISRTSVMTYRDSRKRLNTIARELGVDTILEGGVQRIGDRVRINLQLIDAESDAHLWAQTYTRALTAKHVFAVQAEITETVADALDAILSDDERTQIEKMPTANIQALDAYFLGNQFYNLETTAGIEQAMVAYQQATQFDPDFSLAYSKLAMAVLDQVWFNGFAAEAQLEKSRPLIDQAILLDPRSADAFAALGRWYRTTGDIDKAEQAYKQAMVFEPNNVASLTELGNLKQWDRSDLASALELFEKAVRLDPQNLGLNIQLAELKSNVGLADEAIPLMEGVLEVHPESPGGLRVLAHLYSAGQSRHDKAIRAVRKAYELDPQHPANAYWNAIMHWRLGDYRNAASWMNHAARLAPNSEEAPVYRGWAFINQRNIESASREFSHSNAETLLHWGGIFTLARADVAAGRPEAAARRLEGFLPRFNGRKSFVNFSFGAAAIYAYQALGDRENAQSLLSQLLSVIDSDLQHSYHGVEVLDASVYALSGRVNSALATLGEWVDRGGASAYLQWQCEYELRSLADNPQFQEILHTVESRLSDQRDNLGRWETSGEVSPIPEEVTNPG